MMTYLALNPKTKQPRILYLLRIAIKDHFRKVSSLLPACVRGWLVAVSASLCAQ
jgi:hypothetical protein